MSITCPQCDTPNANSRRVCLSCAAPLHGEVVATIAPASCTLCHHPSPTIRMRHWIDEAEYMPGLEAHLRLEFRQYGNRSELALKLREVASERSRFTNKYAGPDGSWIQPGEAFNQHYAMGQQRNSMIGMQDDFDRNLASRIAQDNLKRKPGETSKDFAKRCLAAIRKPERPGPLAKLLPERVPGSDDELAA